MRLLSGVLHFGLDNWQQVALFVGNGRSRSQCSQRWSRVISPRISKKKWTPEEDQQLRDLVDEFGEKSWTKIASILGNRSDVQCRYHYRQLVNEMEQISLRKESNFTTSTTMVIQEQREMRPPEVEQRPIELGSSRASTSLPMIAVASMMMPISPLVEMPQFRAAITLEKPAKPIQCNAVGSDPDSLNLFLRAFQ
jgi:hypothetical protein